MASKTCSECQTEVPEDSRFCPHCGAAQAVVCTCGHLNGPGSRFCAECGTKLGASAGAVTSPPAVKASRPASVGAGLSSAERRQLTVMFCDLVGSTALSTRLDPEDLREVIAAYHKCAAEVVGSFNGFVAKYMGDGVLIYFGYPEAHENDAENSVRAALAMIDAVKGLAVGEVRQSVRIGVATGLVVVGELVGSGSAQERNVVGETPNLASRLQSAAAPNSVLIAASTRRLVGDVFEYEAVDPGALKGFDTAMSAWRVLRERTMQSRFEALRAATMAPLVGREEEMELLQKRWQQAKSGEGRVVLVSGEAGIGKSRLSAALIESLAGDHPVFLRYFCLPHQQSSALQPVITHLQHAAGFARDDSAQAKRTKLECLLTEGNKVQPEPTQFTNLMAELVGLEPTIENAAPMDPKRKRSQILDALITRVERLAANRPVLMVFEDAHWSDPTSLELLTLTVERIQTLPVFLIISFRPEYQAPWAGQPHVTTMTLNRLNRRERMELVAHVSGGATLPPSLLDQIADRTDGVPLFIEEVTKAILESEQLEDGSASGAARSAQSIEIPETLQASLMARVDRLGSAREVLQVGSAIGREFSYELLAAVAGLPDPVLQDALARLTEAELLMMRGSPPNAVLIFKHALVQDSAYSTMLRARRQQLHGAIAQILEKRFSDTAPEVLAQQFEGAGQNDNAIGYWQKAGERDLRRFAMKESIAHYSNALRVIEATPDAPPRWALELGVLLGLGMALQISIGPGSKEAAVRYQRALALSKAMPERGRERFLATWGVWFHETMTGQAQAAFKRADELLAIARGLNTPDLLVEAYHARTPGLLRIADYKGLKESAQEVIRLYDRERDRDHAFYFGGHDSRVCAQSFYAVSLWGLGFPDQAQQMAWQCIEDARNLGHAFSLAHSLNMGGLTHLLLKDIDACRTVTDELYPLAERNKFPWPLIYARFQKGWLRALSGEAEEGIQEMLQSAEGAPVAVLNPVVWTLIAEQQIEAGQLDAALGSLETALKHCRQSGFYEAEVIRCHGELLLRQSAAKGDQAEAAFRQAIDMTLKQSCRALQLRAATSLARLLDRSGRTDEARDVLAPVYNGFSEGLERADLKAAADLLSQFG